MVMVMCLPDSNDCGCSRCCDASAGKCPVSRPMVPVAVMDVEFGFGDSGPFWWGHFTFPQGQLQNFRQVQGLAASLLDNLLVTTKSIRDD